MNRRLFINLIAGTFVLLVLLLLGRSMRYEPAQAPEPAGSSERVAPEAPGKIATEAAAGEATGEVAGETAAPDPNLAAAAALVTRAEVGFRSSERLAEHYAKHGAEFGEVSEPGYLLLAQALRDRPVEGEVLERVRRDGVVTRFDRASGAFLAFDADLTIRTFFKPNDGEAYFHRQARRDE